MKYISAFSDAPEHICARKINGQLHVWIVANLWLIAKDLPIQEIHVKDIDLDIDWWFQDHTLPTIKNVVDHCRRIKEANLAYPIILGPNGEILDGFHRVAKAYLENKMTLNAKQLRNYPNPDYVLKSSTE